MSATTASSDWDRIDRTSTALRRVAHDARPTSPAALLLTPEEAARRLSVGRTTLYELLARGELRSVSLGRCRRISVAELEAFVERLDSSAVAESSALRDDDIR
jgi:excisionase family DNA binding protein